MITALRRRRPGHPSTWAGPDLRMLACTGHPRFRRRTTALHRRPCSRHSCRRSRRRSGSPRTDHRGNRPVRLRVVLLDINEQ